MHTLTMILVSIALGVGSTLLVQMVLVQPPPVVAVVACPEVPNPTEQALVDKALEPLEGTYQPQGRLLPMPGTGGGRSW
jgi:hypothetical protein